MAKIKFLNRRFSAGELLKLRKSFLRVLPRLLRLSFIINMLKLSFSQCSRLPRVYGWPPLVMVEPTSRCNLSCPMCGRVLGKSQHHERDMSFAEFQLIFDKVKPYLLAVGLWNFGEPFLNEDLFKMVSAAHQERIFTIVLTNGTLLNEEKSRALVDSGLDYLGISMDGASPLTYQKYRRGGDFSAVVDNIKFLIKEKERRKSLSPFVEIIFLVMKDNEQEMFTMARLAREWKVDKLSFKKASFVSDKQVLDISEFLPSDPLFIHPAHKDNFRRRSHCSLPWSQVTIRANGDVVPCCSDYLADKMGNIFIQAYGDIWNGARFKELRRKINQDIEQVPSCRWRCSERSYDAGIFLDAKSAGTR